MMTKRTEAQIEEIIAACDGDIHGALKALMLVNEQLESELAKLQQVVADGAGRVGQTTH
jgi:hypothetical protein